MPFSQQPYLVLNFFVFRVFVREKRPCTHLYRSLINLHVFLQWSVSLGCQWISWRWDFSAREGARTAGYCARKDSGWCRNTLRGWGVCGGNMAPARCLHSFPSFLLSWDPGASFQPKIFSAFLRMKVSCRQSPCLEKWDPLSSSQALRGLSSSFLGLWASPRLFQVSETVNCLIAFTSLAWLPGTWWRDF